MKRIAVMLPEAYRGGTLRGAKIVAKSLMLTARQRNEDLQVVFSYVANGDYNPSNDFNDLRELGITVRPTSWQVVNINASRQYNTRFLKSKLNRPLLHDEYCIPKDGLNDFYDCDLWVLISDRLPRPLYPIKKYACVIFDYIQRYVPGIFPDQTTWNLQENGFLKVAREAERIFVTTPATREDAIAFAGVARERVRLLPMNFEPLDAPESPDNQHPYFLWATNTTLHKNHLNSIKALELYFGSYNGQLDVLVTGEFVPVLDPISELPSIFDVPHIRACRKLLSANPELMRHIRFRRFSDAEYAGALSKAKFLWHTALYDNGAYAALESAYLGVPTLSAHYPAMKFMDQNFGLNLSYFDPANPLDMARSLHWMESNHANVKLPSRESMQNHGWRNNAVALYESVLEMLKE